MQPNAHYDYTTGNRVGPSGRRGIVRARQWTGAHAGIFLIVVFTLCALVMYAIPESSAGTSLAMYAALSVVVLLACMLACPDALARPSRTGLASTMRLAWYPLVLGLAFGCAVAWTWAPLPRAGVMTLVLAAVICLLVGVFEELLFRGILFGTLKDQLKDRRNGLIVAAIVSSVLFGLAHFTGISGFETHPTREIARFVQACAFGLVMCAVYMRAKSLWPAALVHAVYDLLALWPSAFVLGYPNAYLLPEDPVGTGLIVTCAVLMLAALPAALRTFRNHT